MSLQIKWSNLMKKELPVKLNAKYGKGWSVETLKKARKFYEIYSQAKKVYTVDPIKLNFNLSWNHYQILMRIENQEERQFYEDGESDA